MGYLVIIDEIDGSEEIVYENRITKRESILPNNSSTTLVLVFRLNGD